MPLDLLAPAASPSGAIVSHLRSIKAVEIFRVGTWNGDDYTLDDLDEMVRSFDQVGFNVPLKVSREVGKGAHDEGGPAYGWVDRIYRVGDVLKADFRDVPAWLCAAIAEDHAYDAVSSEIYWNLKRDGKTFKRVLKAVALLGAETPAVSGLKPLRDAYFNATDFEKVTCHSIGVAKTEPDMSTEADRIKELEAQLAAKDTQITKLTTDGATALATAQAQVKTQGEQIASMQTSLATLAAQRAVDDVTAKVRACKVPALHEPLRHLYGVVLGDAASKVVKYTTDAAKGTIEDRSIATVLDDVVAWANKMAEDLTKTQSKRDSNVRQLHNKAEDAGVELAEKTRAYMAEHKLKPAQYGEAMIAVLKADADLAERYQARKNGEAA